MADETRETGSVELSSFPATSPYQLVEDMIENVLRADATSAKKQQQLIQSIKQLDQCIVTRNDESAYADAVARAPWLTGDAEQLKRHWQELRQSLHELYKNAGRNDGSRESLIEQFNAVAERFGACEADEQCLLEAAFPGPAWTDENRGPL